ncbi:MAG: helix-turn-helix transcriptional regulator [Chloroflexi bacterium]|nr:helix-turn-helix transcriptional regulator [Chloroflexota bacterium]
MAHSFDEDLERELRDPEFARLFGEDHAKSIFALTLANARLKAGLTQKELAEKAGVSQAYIAKLEGGEANPTLGRIGSLLAVMGLSLVTDVTALSPRSEGSSKDVGKSKEMVGV